MNQVNTLVVFCLLLSQWTQAGAMKEIDFTVRDLVANTYYMGSSDQAYEEYMYNEIWGVNLEDPKERPCLAVVSGFATTYSDSFIGINQFWACVNRTEFGFSAYLLQEIVIE